MAKNAHFHHNRCIFGPKNKKFEKCPIQFFCILEYFILAKFELQSTYTEKVELINMFLRYRDFKSQDPIFRKIGLILPQIQKIFQVLRFFMVYYLDCCEVTPNTMIKSQFCMK